MARPLPSAGRRLTAAAVLSAAAFALLVAVARLAPVAEPSHPADVRLTITSREVGVTSCFIGATEGNVRFDPADLRDLGLNTYRVYGGMSRWEAHDDDGAYGLPTIDEIKADPAVVPWQRWDAAMTEPPRDSDYSWSGDNHLWRGSALDLFSALRANGVRPVLTLRNRDNHDLPSWSPNPPRSAADWNEWWQHVFATAFWLNVRHDLRVDDYEVHNEPDNPPQGWTGSRDEYLLLVESTRDALDHAYATFLPGRAYRLHAPTTVGGSSWPRDFIPRLRDSDALNVHSYDPDVSPYVSRVRGWAAAAGKSSLPIWLAEWGSYEDEYDSVPFAAGLIANLIRTSTPGPSRVEGSHVFALYDWDGFDHLTIPYTNIKGIIGARGERRASYFALRLALRALQGCRTVLAVETSADTSLSAIATRGPAGTSLLIANPNPDRSIRIKVDTSSLPALRPARLWRFDALNADALMSQPAPGQFTPLELPAASALLLLYE